jgi:DtxR family Mn-dependent transcriptional regulator
MVLSESIQDYLKTIYQLRQGAERVTTNALAGQLGIAAASVTGMLKKLSELRLVEYEPYQGARLTPAGEKIALEVIRHHRLLELYLRDAMGYTWDQVHDEAERLEHAISEEFADRMSQLLGDPKIDPHGNPIPSKDGTVAAPSRRKLSDAAPGETVEIERIEEDDTALLRRVAELGLMPGARLVVARPAPGDDAVAARTEHGRRQVRIERDVASRVFVREE